MKLRYNQYITLCLLLVTILFIACKKDFLSNPPTAKAITEEFIVSLSSCDQVLQGCYVKLSTPFYNAQNTTLYAEVTADNVKPVTGSSNLTAPYAWAQLPSEEWTASNVQNMNSAWQSGYAAVRQVALVLENIDKFRDEDTAKADNIKAQALTLRAFVHFQLLSIFSQSYNFTTNASHDGIPYITSSDITNTVSQRGTVAEAYQNVIIDLQTAITLFSNITTNKTSLSKMAAKALLSRVLLFKEDYTASKNLAVEVGNLIPIMSGSNYPAKLFTPQETEAIFQLMPLQNNLNASASTSFPGGVVNVANPSFVATTDIAALLSEFPQDVRKSWIKSSTKGWLINKFPDSVISGFTQPARSHYMTLLKSSEMYLIASECYAKLGKEDSARWYVNAIRTRAYGVGYEILATGQALLDTIAKERRKELAFEGFRMYDLLRYKQGVKRIDANSPDAANLPYPNNKAIAPIPAVDVQVSRLKQNPGYE